MQPQRLTRRDFSKLTMAALGGIAAGCSKEDGGESSPDTQPAGDVQGAPGSRDAAAPSGASAAATDDQQYALLLREPHVCCGLNTCQGQGVAGDNACAGQGTCATAEHHSCHAENACKGQGGCGATAGLNECKGQGGCNVPLSPDTWKQVRAKFEQAMTAAGQEFGPAPESCGKA